MKKNVLKGFTLVEIAMVIIIVGILSVISVSKFFSLSGYRTMVYYDEVLNSLRYARKLAVATGLHYQVSLTATSITIQKRTEGSACNTGTTFQAVPDPANRANSYVKVAPGPVTMTFSGNWPIYFDGLGQALRASNCSLITSETVSIVGGNSITLIGATGLVK